MDWNQTEFGTRLTRVLELKVMTEKKLAEMLTVSPSTVGRWQNSATNKPSLDVISAVSEKLSIRPAWLAFGDEFEPMDDEELQMITAFRKLPDIERKPLLEWFTLTTAARQVVKKPGRRSPRASPLRVSGESAALLPQAETIQRVLADLLEHESVLPVGSKAQISVKSVSTLLDQLVASLQSLQQSDSQKGSGASSPAKAPARAKPSPGRNQSDLPFSSPTDAKS